MLAHSDRAALDALHVLLVKHGYTVAPYGDELEVRISLLIRVRVRIRDGELHCPVYFGLVERARVALLTFVSTSGLTLYFLLSQGITPLSISIGFIALSAGVYEALRFIVAEGFLVRLHSLWAEVRQAMGRPPVPAALGAAEQWPGERAPAPPVDAQRVQR